MSRLIGIVALLASFVPTAHALPSSQPCRDGFVAPRVYDASAAVHEGVVVADFDGDGRPDLFSLHSTDKSGSLGTVLLNRGNNVFAGVPVTIPGAAGFTVVASADLNHDGKMDLLLAGGGLPLTVFFGNGDGTFGSGVATTVRNVTAIATGDFNGDGRVDVAVTQSDPAAFTVLVSDANGGLTTAASYSLRAKGTAITAADFDGDGHLDLVVADALTVTPFWGKGDATFAAGTIIVNAGATSLASGDLDGDGRPDLVIGSIGQITVELAQSGRTFHFAGYNSTFLEQATNVVAIGIADMDRDGIADIVTFGTDEIDIFHGLGGGLFAPAVIYSGAGTSKTGVLIDVDGDGFPDVAVANKTAQDVAVLRNIGGVLEAPHILGIGDTAITMADATNDHIPDLIVGSARLPDLRIYPSLQVSNGLGPRREVPLPFMAQEIRAGDFDGDGFADLAVMDATGQSVVILYGDKSNSFARTATLSFVQPLCCIEVMDMNNDGRADIVFGQKSGNIGVMLSSGVAFAPAVTYPTSGKVTALAIGNLNDDAAPDVAAAVADGGNIAPFTGSSSGALTALPLLQASASQALAIAKIGNSPAIVSGGVVVEVFHLDQTNGQATIDTYPLPAPATALTVANIASAANNDVAIVSTDVNTGRSFLTKLMEVGQPKLQFTAPLNFATAPAGVVTGLFDDRAATDLATLSNGKLLIAPHECEPSRVSAAASVSASNQITLFGQIFAAATPQMPFVFKEGQQTLATVTSDQHGWGFAQATVTLPVGTHTITATAQYVDGSTVTSDPITVVVNAPGQGRRRVSKH